MTDMNETLLDAQFKDEKPINTVEKIRRILRENNIETVEQWMPSGVPYCHSVKISISGTTFFTSGKGMTKEFALASGYGELMERLQLGHISKEQKDGNFSVNNGKEEIVKAADLLQRNRKWYEIYAQRAKAYTGVDMTPEQILAQFTNDDGTVAATLYYSVATQTKEYIPTKLRKLISTANGYAAGNTFEEAIVQASSEIVERDYKIRILSEGISVPNIPEEVLQRYPTAYSIICHLRGKGFRVFVKDCSLGTKFPVICVCYIDERSGKYHTHFGANPLFEIALERALTETFQGRNIQNFAYFGDFLYESNHSLSVENLWHDRVYGEAKRMPDFFVEKPHHQWKESYGFTGKNNKELARECLQFFADQGYDVLLRDGSCLGFPTCQVLIPGYSELLYNRLSPEHNELRYSAYAEKVTRNPSQASLDDMLALLMHIDCNKMNPVAQKLTRMARLAADPKSDDTARILSATMAYVYYELGQYSVVLNHIKQMMASYSQEQQEYLLCVDRYLSMTLHGYDAERIRAVLTVCHRAQTVEAFYACLAENRNPLERFTLHCDGKTCDESCLLHHCCCQKQIDRLANLIVAKTQAMDFDKSADAFRKALLG